MSLDTNLPASQASIELCSGTITLLLSLENVLLAHFGPAEAEKLPRLERFNAYSCALLRMASTRPHALAACTVAARLQRPLISHGLHQRPHEARKAKACELPRSTHHQRPADAAKRFALPKTPLCTPLSVLSLYSGILRVVSQDGDYKACCTQNRQGFREGGWSITSAWVRGAHFSS